MDGNIGMQSMVCQMLQHRITGQQIQSIRMMLIMTATAMVGMMKILDIPATQGIWQNRNFIDSGTIIQPGPGSYLLPT